MSVSILRGEQYAAFYCNTSETAFGPLFTSYEEAEAFRDWLSGDPRTLDADGDLRAIHTEWFHTVWRDDT